MKVLLFKVMEEAKVVDIPCMFGVMQNVVGGYVEIVYPFDDPVAVICNEEGKINGSLPNRALYDDDGNIYDVIYGDFFVCGTTEDDFCDIPDDLVDRYTEAFGLPLIGF